MPLLNRKPYAIDVLLPESLAFDEEVFVIEYTKEVFRDYQTYVAHVELYRKPLWSCKFSGKGGMTFKEAQEEEQKALAALAKFPLEREEQVVRAIHHSMLPIEQLVSRIYDSLRPAKYAEAVAEEDFIAAEGQQEGQQPGEAAQPVASPLDEKKNATQQAQEQKPGTRKEKKPKAPVARGVLRTFLLENAIQQGPEGGRAQVWVVKKDLVEKYHLDAEIPVEIQAKLAAHVKAPKKRFSEVGTEPKSSNKGRKEGGNAKKSVKKPEMAGPSSCATSPQAVAVAAGKDATMAVSVDEGMDDSEPAQPVTAKTLEEVEAQYKPGSVKHVMVQVFKAVRPEGLTVAGVADKAKKMGLADYDDKQRKSIRHAFSHDSNFVRLRSGVYSLHCFHPDLVVLQKPAAPRKRKITDFTSPAGAEEIVGGESKPLSKMESRAHLAAEKEEGEVDSVTKAERLVKHAKAAAEKHRATLAKAQSALNAAKKQLADAKKTIKSPGSKGRDSDVYIPAEQLARFELTEAEREFKGDSSDRKALLEHRQFLQKRVKELEAEKKKFIEAERVKREAERAKQEEELKNSNSEYKGAEAVMKKREHDLAIARKAAESAEKALADAERKLINERKKVEAAEAKAKEKEEKEKQRQAEKEERERRKAEALAAKAEAKRYPMEDLQLLQELTQAAAESGEAPPPTDVCQPNWLDGEEQAQLVRLLCISDFLHQFGKSLGVKTLSFADLERILAGASDGKTSRCDEDMGASALHTIYQRLMQVLLDDLHSTDEMGPLEKRWRAVLSEATWPEVLRRFVLTRAHSEEAYKRGNEHVSLAAGMLGFDSADALTHDQHLHLLGFLCDEALDTEKMRSVLQRRADGADDAKHDILKEMAEERRKLKDMQDQEKEERKHRREEDKKKQEEERAIAAAAAATAIDGQDVSGHAALGTQASMEASAAATPAEPSFSLPEELQEYNGDPDDKKAILQFRQQQQAERRRLEKAKNKWMADQLRRQREIEAKLKEQRETEKVKQNEREAVAAAIARAQEDLEEALERYSTRHEPLGMDRQHRRYWWGLGAHHSAVYVEDEQGKWGSFTTLKEIENLMDSLDRRGVRESSLAQALDKRYHRVATAIRKVELQEEKGREKEAKGGKKEKPASQPLRRSTREAQQVEFFNPSKETGSFSRPSSAAAVLSNGKLAAAPDLALVFGTVELAAFEGALADMLAIQKAAASVDPPSGSWNEWLKSLKATADGRVEGSKQSTAAALRSALQVRLQELEAVVYGVSDKREEESSDGDEETEEGEQEGSHEMEVDRTEERGLSSGKSFEVLEYVDSDAEMLSPSKVKDVTWLWRSAKERAIWQADLAQALTTTRVAYCASVLLQQAEPLLQYVRRASRNLNGKATALVGAKEDAPKGVDKTAFAAATEENKKEVEQRKAREARAAARELAASPTDRSRRPLSGTASERPGPSRTVDRPPSGKGESKAGSGKRKAVAVAASGDGRVTRSRK